MNRPYTRELRADSTDFIIPGLTTITVVLALIGVWSDLSLAVSWHFILITILALLTGRRALKLIKSNEAEKGSALFIGVYLFILTLLMARAWQPGSAIPYFYAALTVISSMLIHPTAGFYTFGFSLLLIPLGARLSGNITPDNVLGLGAPILFNLVMAGAAFLSAWEWQTAVESVSVLHRRAQGRRDELFAMKEEVSQTNERLVSLNRQLEKARQEALNERDIRTRFMNNVSHELRTPLNSIVNFAHILGEGSCGPVTDWQVDYLTRIEDSGWHLLNMLNDLLDMAQIESGEFKLYLEESDLYSICVEAMSSVQGLVLAKEGIVDLIPDYPETWYPIMTDRMRLKQALINLLGNAAKYTEEGEIVLRVRYEPDYVTITVSDTGIGIDPRHHEAIFQEFRQLDETAARRRIGTGLGLPITKHLVERHGGQISVESAVGEGSTFAIKLPRHQAQAASANGVSLEKGASVPETAVE